MARLPTRRLLVGAALVLALAAAFMWLFPSRDFLYVPNEARRMKVRYGLNNSFGFGGTNAALVLKKYEV